MIYGLVICQLLETRVRNRPRVLVLIVPVEADDLFLLFGEHTVEAFDGRFGGAVGRRAAATFGNGEQRRGGNGRGGGASGEEETTAVQSFVGAIGTFAVVLVHVRDSLGCDGGRWWLKP